MAALIDSVMQPTGTEKETVGASSVQSDTKNNGRDYTIVRLTATVDTHIEIGANPTATTSSMLLPKGVVEYFKVNSGDKIAHIQSSSGGDLYITTVS